MKFLVITDDATLADLEEAIVNLRAKQRQACIASTRDELDRDINELLLDMREARLATA